MATPALARSVLGLDDMMNAYVTNGANSYAMASLNTGWAARFTAPDTRDIKTVYLNFGTVTAGGCVITLTIETIDPTTRKPTGTLYDAAATKTFTPATGWNAVTFDTLPTTGLTAGTEYAVVALTTTGGTTVPLNAGAGAQSYPTLYLTAADGTTRSNFAEVATSTPIMSIVFEDDVEESFGWIPFPAVATQTFFTTAAYGLKVTKLCGFKLLGYRVYLGRTGTPAGDLVIKTWNGNSAVSGTTRTIVKESLAGVNGRRVDAYLPTPVSLAAGTYRMMVESQSSANSSNCFSIRTFTGRSASVVPSGLVLTSTADITAGTISWSDDTTKIPVFMALIADDVAATGGGFAGQLGHRVSRRDIYVPRRTTVIIPRTVTTQIPIPSAARRILANSPHIRRPQTVITPAATVNQTILITSPRYVR